jgi:hypothetical protein
VEELLVKYSAIKRVIPPGDPLVTRNIYAWEPLGNEGLQLQSRLLSDYRRFSALLEVVLRGQSQDTLDTLGHAGATVEEVIQQDGRTYYASKKDALKSASESIDAIVNLLERLYTPSEDDTIVVPDTNALYINSKLESWTFPDASEFTIMILPSVLSDLDKHKMFHTNPHVRDKAKVLINRLKEYFRRGEIEKGVPVIKGVRMASVAIEPDMDQTLPWLKRDNEDDRLLASFLEVMRSRPRSAVVLVTADINLQNKARYARVFFVEPPEPNPTP